MVFSLSTLCTHVVIGSALLLAARLFLRGPSRHAHVGFTPFIACLFLLSLRLVLPFEWGFTRSIYIQGLYPQLMRFFNQMMWYSGSYHLRLYHLVLIIFAFVSFARMARMLFGQVRYIRYLDALPQFDSLSCRGWLGIRCKVRCVADPHSSNAMALGLLRPRIVLPGTPLTSREREAVLRHELSHFQSGDVWLKFFVEVVCALCWWLPFIGELRRQAAAMIEFRADRNTTAAMDEHEKLAYLSCLLKIAKNSPREAKPLAVGLISNRESVLKERFNLILEPQKCNVLISFLSVLFAVMMLTSSFIVFEPFAVSDQVRAESYTISAAESFFVQREDGGYDLYVDGGFIAVIYNIPDEFKEFPVYKNGEEEYRE